MDPNKPIDGRSSLPWSDLHLILHAKSSIRCLLYCYARMCIHRIIACSLVCCGDQPLRQNPIECGDRMMKTQTHAFAIMQLCDSLETDDTTKRIPCFDFRHA